MTGMIAVKEYTSGAEMMRAAVVNRAGLMSPANRYVAPEAKPEADAKTVYRLVQRREWKVQIDAHVVAYRFAKQARRIAELELRLREIEAPWDAVGLPRCSARDVIRNTLIECATNGAGNFSFTEIMSDRRYLALTNVRHACVAAVVRYCPQMSYVQIGRLFNRDHSTIIYVAKKAGLRQ
tara:strand:- start:4906 stop:5445 length:540 start_codon:yes stop_codon:yes gene_type:complete